MEAYSSRKMRRRESWASSLAQDLLEPVRDGSLPGPHHPADFAERLYASESLKSASPGLTVPQEPFSLQWFLDIETHRHGRHGRWLPQLLEFAKHRGETLLGLGHGLGTDWLQYARHGAHVIVCSPSSEQIGLIRRNFEVRGLSGRFLNSGFASLPLPPASIDVACVSSLLHEVESPEVLVEELFRVLKPGGKVLAVSPAFFDVDFWSRTWFPWSGWWLRRGAGVPSCARFTGRELRSLFGRFIEQRIHNRHLRRAEVPHLWRWLPSSILERIMGRVLVIKAFKPVSIALPAFRAAAA